MSKISVETLVRCNLLISARNKKFLEKIVKEYASKKVKFSQGEVLRTIIDDFEMRRKTQGKNGTGK